MDQRIYHGGIKPSDFAQELVANFNRGNYQVQQIGGEDRITVQIATKSQPASGGKTALTISLQAIEDGVVVNVGQQAWLGVAASLGFTALMAFKNPLALLGRIDDLAQDIENLQLSDEVWRILENTAKSIGASQELSEKLRRLVCTYCNTANPVGEPRCIACGAPLGDIQPVTCNQCGFVLSRDDKKCPNCGVLVG